MTDRPTVIVGAGPAGAALALLLARQGIPVVLFEASTDPARRFRGEALMPHGLAVLEAMGLLPLPGTIPQQPLEGWRFLLDGQELFQLPEPLEGGDGPGCTLISQPALLRHLLALVRRCPRATVLEGQRVQALLWSGDRIAGVRLADGTAMEAQLVVAADGRSSALRQQARLVLHSQAPSFDLLWFQVDADTRCPLEGRFTTAVGQEGLFSAFEGASGGVQIGWVQPPGARNSDRDIDGAGWGRRLAALSPPELAVWWREQSERISTPTRLPVMVGQAERWWRPGLLLLGDAAHPLSPVRAQGLNLALRDAWVAARALAPVLGNGDPAGWEPDAALPRALAWIERQRRPEISGLQERQAAETRRGRLLLEQPLLRRWMRLQGPWLGNLVARRWRHDQTPLRQGLVALPGLPAPAPDGARHDGGAQSEQP